LRFNYHDSKITYINHPEKTMGVKVTENDVIYPDILVVLDGKVSVSGEIETEESVDEEEASQWAKYSEYAGPLYLYVPKGYALKADMLASGANIPLAGIRKYSTDFYGNLVIENY